MRKLYKDHRKERSYKIRVCLICHRRSRCGS
jgi:hypothetical protein